MKQKRLPLWDLSFALWLMAESVLPHSLFAVIVMAVFCTIAVFRLLTRAIKVRVPVAIACYAVLILVCAGNILFKASITPEQSWAMIGTMAKNLLFMICLSLYFSYTTPGRLKTLFSDSMVAASLFLVAYALITTGTLHLRSTEGLNANVLAMCNAVAVLFLAYDRKRVNAAKLLKLAVLLSLMVLSGTRKASLGLIIGICVCFLLVSERCSVLNFLKAGAAVLAAYLLVMKTSWGYQFVGSRLESMLAVLSGGEADGSSLIRMQYIRIGWAGFLQSPLIGRGIDCFRSAQGSYGTYSHCNYIELLFGVGALGTIVYYIPHFSVLAGYIVARCKKRHTRNAALAAVLAVMLLFFDVAWVSYYHRIALTLLMTACYLLRKDCEDEIHESPEESASPVASAGV